MAAAFSIGEQVKVNIVVPQGPVQKIQFNNSGEIEYLIAWTDSDGTKQSRWFTEDSLIAAVS